MYQSMPFLHSIPFPCTPTTLGLQLHTRKTLIPSFLSVSGFHRRCDVWKNGIQWWNINDITTSVELVDQSRFIQVVMLANKASIVEFVQLRSAIIHLILSLNSKLCPSLDASQYLIAPSELLTVPLPPLGKLTLFSTEDFAHAVTSFSITLHCR